MNKTKIATVGIVAVALILGSTYAFGPAFGMWGGNGGYGPGMMSGYYGAPPMNADGTTVTPGYGGYACTGEGHFTDTLTDDQKAAIDNKIAELRDEGAYPWEIHGEVWKLLEEYGVTTDGQIDADGDGNPDSAYGYRRGYGHGGGYWMRGW